MCTSGDLQDLEHYKPIAGATHRGLYCFKPKTTVWVLTIEVLAFQKATESHSALGRTERKREYIPFREEKTI